MGPLEPPLKGTCPALSDSGCAEKPVNTLWPHNMESIISALQRKPSGATVTTTQPSLAEPVSREEEKKLLPQGQEGEGHQEPLQSRSSTSYI